MISPQMTIIRSMFITFKREIENTTESLFRGTFFILLPSTIPFRMHHITHATSLLSLSSLLRVSLYRGYIDVHYE
jgi:hypothetical protein